MVNLSSTKKPLFSVRKIKQKKVVFCCYWSIKRIGIDTSEEKNMHKSFSKYKDRPIARYVTFC